MQPQNLKRPAFDMHPLPSKNQLPSWASDLAFPTLPVPQQPLKHAKMLFYNDKEMEYVEQLCEAYWTLDPDIDLRLICQELAAEVRRLRWLVQWYHEYL